MPPPPVGASCVEVAHPSGVGRVEHLMCAQLHRGLVRSLGEIRAVAEVDVTRPAERGETEANSANGWTRRDG